MNALQLFSDWVLLALPRLFIFPGGLWLFFMLIVMRVLQKGGLRSFRIPSLTRDFLAAPPLSLALAWVGVALLPLPGASTLTFPADIFLLTALPLISLAADNAAIRRELGPSLAVTLAILSAALTGRDGMFAGELGWPLTVMLLLTVGVGALAIRHEKAPCLSSDVRLLAWLGLGLLPLLYRLPTLPDGILWSSLVYALLIATVSLLARLISARLGQQTLTLIAYGFASACLLLAILNTPT